MYSELPTRSDKNRDLHKTKMVSGLKFWMYKVGRYTMYVSNQLPCSLYVPLFSHMPNAVVLMTLLKLHVRMYVCMQYFEEKKF